MNLLHLLRDKSKKINESRFGVPFTARRPDGSLQTLDAVTGEPLRTMQIVYNTVRQDTVNGEDVVAPDPNITIHATSLDPVPNAGENWIFTIPVSPVPGAAMKSYLMSPDRIFKEDVLGAYTIQLQELIQTPEPEPEEQP